MKFDGNASQVRKACIDAGATFEWIIRAPGPGLQGLPDALVGLFGINYLLEVKKPGEKLTNDQPAWHERWRGLKPIVVTTAEEALVAIGAVNAKIAGAR